MSDDLSQDEIDALLSMADALQDTKKPVKKVRKIKKIVKKKAPAKESSSDAPEDESAEEDSGGNVGQEDIDAMLGMLDSDAGDETPPPPPPTPAVSVSEKKIESADEIISQDEIDSLLGSIDDDQGEDFVESASVPLEKPSVVSSEPLKKAVETEVLSQSAIDSLFSDLGLDDDSDTAVEQETRDMGDIPQTQEQVYQFVSTQPTHDLSSKSYKLYNFRRPEKLSRDQVRQMKPHFEAMTRDVTNFFSMQLKTSVETSLLDIDQINYGDIFKKLDHTDIVGIFNLYPSSHSGIVEFSTRLFYCIIERMMGGTGESHLPIRKITDFERYLISDIFDHFLQYWCEVIKKFMQIEPQVETVESDKYLIPRTLSDEEVLVRMIFDVKINNVTGLIRINVPYNFISPFFSKLRFAMDKDAVVEDELTQSIERGSIARIDVPVSVEFNSRRMNVADVLSLKAGDLIMLEHPYESELLVKIKNQPKFYCRPGVLNSKLAIKITGPLESED